MANLSNRNTQSNITTNTTCPKFKAGDAVLCPSLGNTVFTLQSNNDGGRSVIIRIGESAYRFFNDGRKFPESPLPDLFHDTPENRQAIATLYPNAQLPTVMPLGAKGAKRHTIDVTQAEDSEVILLPSMMLSDTASEVFGAYEALHDIGQLLHLIYSEKITSTQARSMARLAHDSTEVWVDILYYRIEKLNTPLSQSKFGKVKV